jgi:hypothetical protein
VIVFWSEGLTNTGRYYTFHGDFYTDLSHITRPKVKDQGVTPDQGSLAVDSPPKVSAPILSPDGYATGADQYNHVRQPLKSGAKKL